MPEAQNHVWRWHGLGLNFTGIMSLNSHNSLMRLVPLSLQSHREGNGGSERSGRLPKVTQLIRVRSADLSDSKIHAGNRSASLPPAQFNTAITSGHPRSGGMPAAPSLQFPGEAEMQIGRL